MKTRHSLFSAIIASALIATGFQSCTKDDTSALAFTGSANVIVANAAEGSLPQDYYSDTTKVTGSAVAYAQNTGYLTTAAGTHQSQFRTTNTTTVNASTNITFESGKYYTVYLSGSATSSNSIFATENDRTAPADGKARIRFVHLSTAVSGSVDFGLSTGEKIVSSLAYQTASVYNTVDASTSFNLYLAGSSTVSLAIPVVLQAGKIYTVFVSGSTTATLSYHLILEN